MGGECRDYIEEDVILKKSTNLKNYMKKREMIINEIMKSEEVYVNRLLVIKDVYLVPIKKEGILTKQEFEEIFSQLDSIYNLHVKLFSELADDFNEGTMHVGSIFKDFSHFLKIYKQYLTCFAGGGMAKRVKLLTTNKKFADFVSNAEMDSRCEGSVVMSYS